jgi:isocitrate dehydrogenase (NADP) (EC 1.1.1.42)
VKNTEDVYAGIEYESGSPEAKRLISFLRDELGANVDLSAGVGIKPMTEFGSKRLVRKAIQYALAQGKPSVTLVHKGNIMKFTEGAFSRWGYELAADEFGGETVAEAEEGPDNRKLVIKDRIADNNVSASPDEARALQCARHPQSERGLSFRCARRPGGRAGHCAGH